MNKEKYIDMPKLLSPFIRENVAGNYVCTPKINENLRWVFSSDCVATEKFDGTNVSILIENRKIVAIYNRKNRIDMFAKGSRRFIEGILEAIEKDYLNLKKLKDGRHFGELIGPQVNGNPYNRERHLWIPLDYIKEHYRFKFWNDFVKELDNLTDEQIFNKVSEVFKGLWSLYKRKHRVIGEVNEKTKFEGLAAEGIVFYKADREIKLIPFGEKMTAFELCKLRRDMFEWFRGERHQI